MLKRLKRSFIATTMTLVGVVMLAMIFMSYMNAQVSLDTLVSRSLDRALEASGATSAASKPLGMEHLPVLWLEIGTDGTMVGSNQSQISIGADELTAVLADATQTGASEGRLAQEHLTWRTTATSRGGWRIAIADTTAVDAARTTQLVGNVILCAFGMGLLLVIASRLASWMLAPVERAWEQQHQFVADASHELKTPLAVILANTQILRGEASDLPEESRRWVESTSEEAEHMKGLVEDLLELARTEESGGSRHRELDCDLSSVVEGEALQFDAVAFERGCLIACEVAPDVHVCGDPDQLERLVKILVDNACKYARVGSTITVSLARQAGAAELAVTNQGTPIDAQDLPHVFDRFYRSDKARERTQGGYGLGLAIAKGIADAHAGKISCTSSEEAGTCFSVRLPLGKER